MNVPSPHAAVLIRSDGCCEAMVKLPSTWTRCGRRGVEVHHRITRARGGELLDGADETYHLIALCPAHHKDAHENRDDYGMIIDGYVHHENGQLIYQGSDPYLKAKYEARSSSAGGEGGGLVPLEVQRVSSASG